MFVATILPRPVSGGSRLKMILSPRFIPLTLTSSRRSRSLMFSECRNASGFPLLIETNPNCLSIFHVFTIPRSFGMA